MEKFCLPRYKNETSRITSDQFLSSRHNFAEFSCFFDGIRSEFLENHRHLQNSYLIKEKHQIGTSEIVSYVFSFSGRKFLTIILIGILLEKADIFSYCLSFRPREGLKLLSDTESQWQPRASLVTHVWWHKALFHFQLGTVYLLGQ